jgi:hypothetical protein
MDSLINQEKNMIKRECNRFKVLGATLYYKKMPLFWGKEYYTESYYPVIDLSKGGLKFLCNNRLKPGESVMVKLSIPEIDEQPEIRGIVRWISRNREHSYRYQTGISFNSYGLRKKENPVHILSFLKSLESSHTATIEN